MVDHSSRGSVLAARAIPGRRCLDGNVWLASGNSQPGPVPSNHRKAIGENIMDTLLAKQISPAPFTVREVAELSFETGQLLALGRQEHWDFRVLGQAPMPERPVRLGEWLLAPPENDSSSIPPRAPNPVQTIFSPGPRPEGFVPVDATPKHLSA